jgi:hypothetical protein
VGFIKFIFKRCPKRDRAGALQLIKGDWKNLIWQQYYGPWNVAQGYALIEEKEVALDWLENVINKGWFNYPLFSQLDPFLANIRNEPRFKKLMERVKYEWEHFEV